MQFNVRFNESNQSFTPNFGVVNAVSDGGYERGLAEGYASAFGALPEVLALEKATSIRDYACYYQTAVKTVDMPNVERVGKNAFYQCSKLETVSLPSATAIGEYAFSRCAKLSDISLPNAATVEQYAFTNCTSLEKVSLPKVQRIMPGTFNSCTNLQVADFTSATNFYVAFTACSSLKALILRTNGVCSLSSVTLFSATLIAKGTGYVYAPKAYVDQYKASSLWKNYVSQIRPLEDYTVDGTTTGELDTSKI